MILNTYTDLTCRKYWNMIKFKIVMWSWYVSPWITLDNPALQNINKSEVARFIIQPVRASERCLSHIMLTQQIHQLSQKTSTQFEFVTFSLGNWKIIISTFCLLYITRRKMLFDRLNKNANLYNSIFSQIPNSITFSI